jgi:hypothetical protein
MKIINNLAETKPTRTIATCTKDEAFRLGGFNWYSKIEMSDICIRFAENGMGRDFVENHTLFGHENAHYIELVPCIHLPSMSFVYIDGNRTAEEWATLSATLTTP